MLTALLIIAHSALVQPGITAVAYMAPEEFLALDCSRTHNPPMCQTVQAVLHALTRHPGQPIEVRISKCAQAIAVVTDAVDVGTEHANAADTCRKVASAFNLQ